MSFAAWAVENYHYAETVATTSKDSAAHVRRELGLPLSRPRRRNPSTAKNTKPAPAIEKAASAGFISATHRSPHRMKVISSKGWRAINASFNVAASLHSATRSPLPPLAALLEEQPGSRETLQRMMTLRMSRPLSSIASISAPVSGYRRGRRCP